eukprot:SAG31_NODE_21386_length_551_cov_0.714602_1_plen_107_part_10
MQRDDVRSTTSVDIRARSHVATMRGRSSDRAGAPPSPDGNTGRHTLRVTGRRLRTAAFNGNVGDIRRLLAHGASLPQSDKATSDQSACPAGAPSPASERSVSSINQL